MKKYIFENIKPLMIGFIFAVIIVFLFQQIQDVIIKIALINAKKY